MGKINKKRLLLFILPIIVLPPLVYVSFGIYMESRSTRGPIDPDEVPKIKHIGIDLDKVVFSQETMGQLDLPYIGYGYRIPETSAGPAKTNPQPTFVVPVGTEVHSLVDGTVYSVEKLYSGDYTVRVKTGRFSRFIFETEHVANPRVKKGDKVKAGDVVAEVGDFDTHNFGGNGLVETGIAVQGQPQAHICPFQYLDGSIKEQAFADMRDLYKRWHEFRGETVYDLNEEYPGCVNTDTVFEE